MCNRTVHTVLTRGFAYLHGSRQRLAIVQRLQDSKLMGVLLHEVSELVQNLATLTASHARPGSMVKCLQIIYWLHLYCVACFNTVSFIAACDFHQGTKVNVFCFLLQCLHTNHSLHVFCVACFSEVPVDGPLWLLYRHQCGFCKGISVAVGQASKCMTLFT